MPLTGIIFWRLAEYSRLLGQRQGLYYTWHNKHHEGQHISFCPQVSWGQHRWHMKWVACPCSGLLHSHWAQCPKRWGWLDFIKWPSFALTFTWVWPIGNTNRRKKRNRRRKRSEYLFLRSLPCKAAFLRKALTPDRQPPLTTRAIALPKLWILGSQPLPLSFQP